MGCSPAVVRKLSLSHHGLSTTGTGTPLLFGFLDKFSIRMAKVPDQNEGHYVRQIAVGGNHSVLVLGAWN